MSSTKVTLACESCRSKNYRVKKSIENRLEVKKYCGKCNSHTMHKEEK